MKEKIIKKIDDLISDCKELLEKIKYLESNPFTSSPNEGGGEAKFHAFKASTLSFLSVILGNEEIYYKAFQKSVMFFQTYNLTIALEILQKIRKDVDEGWLKNLKGLISAEIFSDFFQMSEHLLEENYKDAAAVIIGSTLEENIRELCNNNKIATTSMDLKTGKVKFMTAESMNAELYKAKVYNNLVQQSVTSWLALRNNAAHGKYHEYDVPQVKNLLQAVRDFTAKYL